MPKPVVRAASLCNGRSGYNHDWIHLASHLSSKHKLKAGIKLTRYLLIFIAFVISGCSTLSPRSNADWVGYKESGKASYYANSHQSKKTASGELYKQELKTGAHKVLPFGSLVKVTNVDTAKSVIVKINDRGPYVKGRVIDLSKSAFSEIGSISNGVIDVQIEVIE
ncbi:septal ring lytic transglycosylase RlpA family protein [Methylophilus sp. Leaf414]|uniref:septal ring lytic transglycosylase RlpA family protein n=1 Tax=Methylophilus sp. Leaf414 TaxID=1736371 RepID=UPI0009E95D6C|nr:septal ring lytic transglycosylase RlpA family protein [Methylophilus sp. Leaf414]